MITKQLQTWLKSHDNNLNRFKFPILIKDVARETGLDIDQIRQTVGCANPSITHVFSHVYGGRSRPSKPYCLRLMGNNAVGIDWEDSVLGGLQNALEQRGYRCGRELGTESDVAHLIVNFDPSQLLSGTNQRDLIASQWDSQSIDCWIIEGKGKYAAEFDYFMFAQGLGQLFSIPDNLLSDLLGSRTRAPGKCWEIAQQLIIKGWYGNYMKVRIVLALALPWWQNDVVWRGGRIVCQNVPYYHRPVETFIAFLNGQPSLAKTGRFKYQRIFGEILEHLEQKYRIRKLSYSNAGICFRILLVGGVDNTGNLLVSELPK